MTDITAPVRRAVCRATRIRIQLTLGKTFSSAHVADLMAHAARWGADEAYARGCADARRAALAEVSSLNLAAIHAAVFAAPVYSGADLVRSLARKDARNAADLAARVPWPNDHRGGPVPEWDLGPEVAARAERLAADLEALPRVPNPARSRVPA